MPGPTTPGPPPDPPSAPADPATRPSARARPHHGRHVGGHRPTRRAVVRAAPPEPVTGAGVPAAAAVLGAVRRAGVVFRDELVTATGLSHATVNRQVVALIAAGVVRERPDLVPTGTVGRPRIPLEIDTDRFGVLGLHVGLHRTTLAVGDLRGTVLSATDVPTPRDSEPGTALAGLAARLRRFAARGPGRTVLQVGLVVGGQVSGERDRFGHPRLGWDPAPLADIVDRVGLPGVVVPQIEAMAGAESLLSPHVDDGTTLHIYAREAVGAVLTVDGHVHAPAGGPGTISHLPVGGDGVLGREPCHCGRTGCLEAAAGDSAVARAAHAAGIVDAPVIEKVVTAAEGGDRRAHDLLAERAALLGRGVALVRDVLNPDRVVLAGQAFTAYRAGLAHVSRSFAAASALPPISLQAGTFGSALQAVAACTAGLRPVYADPLGTTRRATARGPHHPVAASVPAQPRGDADSTTREANHR
ncbi:ROK family protein [Pseudonocardia tropica]|uniref:ROK family protein n=1 Tax=Pseudonocardia tropica TaxID=681289 RepID=A0ABV1JSY4_9PSEU